MLSVEEHERRSEKSLEGMIMTQMILAVEDGRFGDVWVSPMVRRDCWDGARKEFGTDFGHLIPEIEAVIMKAEVVALDSHSDMKDDENEGCFQIT